VIRFLAVLLALAAPTAAFADTDREIYDRWSVS